MSAFPFLSTCLLVSATVSLERSNPRLLYTELRSIHDANPGLDQDVNGGRTIIDITDPSDPRYAFMSKYIASSTPLPEVLKGAQTFAQDVHPLIIPDDDIDDEIDSLQARSKLSGEAAECLGFGWKDRYDQGPDARTSTKGSLSSLRQMSMDRFTKEALVKDDSEKDVVIWLQEAGQLPDFVPKLRAYLASDPSAVCGKARSRIIGTAFKGCETVDLCEFEDMTMAEVMKIVRILLEEKSARVRRLILPDVDDMTIEVLQSLVNNGQIRTLDVGNFPLVTHDELWNIVRPRSLGYFACSTFYHHSFDTDQKPVAFQMSIPPQIELSNSISRGPHNIIYMRYDEYYQSRSRRGRDNWVAPRLNDGGLRWSEIYDRAGRIYYRNEQDLPGSGMLSCFVCPMQDIVVPGSNFILTLLMMMSRLLNTSHADLLTEEQAKKLRLELGVRLALFTASMVCPMPAGVYGAWKDYKSDRTLPPLAKFPQFVPVGSWSLYVLHERYAGGDDVQIDDNDRAVGVASNVRYALVQNRPDGSVLHFDGEQFLRHVAPQFGVEAHVTELVGGWHELIDALESNGEDLARLDDLTIPTEIAVASAAEVKEALLVVEKYNEEVSS